MTGSTTTAPRRSARSPPRWGNPPAALAHRYALSMSGVDSVVLGVKNRAELAECVRAAAQGPLDADLVTAIDAAVA